MEKDKRILSIYKESVPTLGPEAVWLDLTNRCNLRCISCWHRSPLLGDEEPPAQWHDQELPFDVVIRLIDELADLGTRKLWISGGGDPLLYRKAFDVISHAGERGLRTLLTTNFSAVSKETIKELLTCGLNKLVVSIWAATPQTYIAVHPGSSESLFERIIDQIRKLTGLRPALDNPSLVIDNVILNLNYHEIGGMVELAVDLGACDAWFNVMDVASKEMKRLLLSPEQIEKLQQAMASVRERYEGKLPEWQSAIVDFTDFEEKITNSQAVRGLYHTDIIDNIGCYAGWYIARVLANGDVCPCCKADRFPLGNILDEPFSEIWRSPAYQEFRLNAKNKSKFDSYFGRINCPKVCDNYWINKLVERRYKEYLASRRPVNWWHSLKRRIAESLPF